MQNFSKQAHLRAKSEPSDRRFIKFTPFVWSDYTIYFIFVDIFLSFFDKKICHATRGRKNAGRTVFFRVRDPNGNKKVIFFAFYLLTNHET